MVVGFSGGKDVRFCLGVWHVAFGFLDLLVVANPVPVFPQARLSFGHVLQADLSAPFQFSS